MKRTARFTAILIALALIVLVPTTLFAAGDLPPQPSPAEWLNATVAQAVAWLIAFGISAAIAYVLNQFPNLDTKVKTAIGSIVTAVLIAGATAIGNLIPQEWLDKTIFDAVIAVLTLIINGAGLFVGGLKGSEHFTARMLVRSKVAAAKTNSSLLAFLFLFLAVALVALVLAPVPAFADGPQPVQYAMVQCSGLPLSIVVKAEQDFDTAYGFTHNLKTPEQWQSTYAARVNEFAASLGCPQVLQDNITLTFWSKLYVPTYQRILTLYPD